MSEKRGRDTFYKYKSILNFGAKCYKLLPKRIRLMVWNGISRKKGTIRIAQRYMLCKSLGVDVGDNVSIHDNVFFFNIEKMKFGNNVSVHPMCYFQASGGIEIGNDVSIAHGVTLMTQNHSYEDISIPIKDQPVISEPIIIEDNVWIGAKATVLYSRRIGKNSVIAAGAVVTKDVPPNTVVAGVPACVIKELT